jgi:hypothetical protein
MLTRQHALKSSKQIESKSTLNNPADKIKSAKSKSTPSKSTGKAKKND